jgi:predicted MFS family arabinose efflux permease
MSTQVLNRTQTQELEAGRLQRILPDAGGLLAVPGFLAMSFSNAIVHAASMRVQGMVVAWLVLEMTGSKLWLGIVSGVPSISIVLFSLLGGLLADSRDARRTLIVSRTLLAAMAFVVAVLASSGQMQIATLMLFVLLSVGVMAADMPVARTLVLQAVGSGRLMSAGAANLVTLNLFNVGGPLALGLLIGKAGGGSALFVLSGAYIVALVLLLRVPPADARPAARGTNPLAEVMAGLAYVRSTPLVAAFVAQGFVAILAGVYFGMVPVYARDVLRVGPEGLGVLTASFSVGSLTGAAYMTAHSGLRRRGRLILLLSIVFAVGMVAFAFSGNLWLSCLISFVLGVTAAFWQNTLSAVVQIAAAPAMRGRVLAVFLMGFQLASFGWLLGGVVATLLSPQAAVSIAGVAFGVLSLLIYAACREAREID